MEDNNNSDTFKYIHNTDSNSGPEESSNNQPTEDQPIEGQIVKSQPDNATTNSNHKAKKNTSGMSITSFVMAIIPVVMAIFCFIVSGGQLQGSLSSKAGIWFIFVMYYMTIGIPIAIMSIIFGIIGIVREVNHKLAIVALAIKLVMLILAIFMVVVPVITSLNYIQTMQQTQDQDTSFML